MAKKPNYNFERQEREKAKAAKKAAKRDAKSEQPKVPTDDLPSVHGDAGPSSVTARISKDQPDAADDQTRLTAQKRPDPEVAGRP